MFIAEELRVNHETLGNLRAVETRFLSVKAIMENFIDVLEELKTLAESLSAYHTIEDAEKRDTLRRLENHRKQANAYSRTSQFLQQQSNITASLLSDTLAFRDQYLAQLQSDRMLRLSRIAAFLTILTFFYLPWTAVSVSLLFAL
jgi:Mg2+ and Co2+ transporter CorA